MIVVDTSALLGVLVGEPKALGLVDRLRLDGDLHVPHLLDVEFQHGLRRLVLSGALGEDRARDARADFADLTMIRYPHVALADRMWELRHNVTPYDATFIALAESLMVPLVTCDARLGRAPGHSATVEVFAPS